MEEVQLEDDEEDGVKIKRNGPGYRLMTLYDIHRCHNVLLTANLPGGRTTVDNAHCPAWVVMVHLARVRSHSRA